MVLCLTRDEPEMVPLPRGKRQPNVAWELPAEGTLFVD